jgi:hypothetical protein
LHKGEWGERKPKLTEKIIQREAPSLDLAQAVVDPEDEETVWMGHVFGKKTKTGYEFVFGAVRP